MFKLKNEEASALIADIQRLEITLGAVAEVCDAPLACTAAAGTIGAAAAALREIRQHLQLKYVASDLNYNGIIDCSDWRALGLSPEKSRLKTHYARMVRK
jgi:hypothetical protein